MMVAAWIFMVEFRFFSISVCSVDVWVLFLGASVVVVYPGGGIDGLKLGGRSWSLLRSAAGVLLFCISWLDGLLVLLLWSGPQFWVCI